MNRKAIDAYITNSHRTDLGTEPCVCPLCGAIKEVALASEYGNVYVVNEDDFCERCEAPMLSKQNLEASLDILKKRVEKGTKARKEIFKMTKRQLVAKIKKIVGINGKQTRSIEENHKFDLLTHGLRGDWLLLAQGRLHDIRMAEDWGG